MIIMNKVLTMADVKALNNEPNSTVILKNTIGQDANIIEKISKNVTISVICGYDAERYKKYKEQKYVDRTHYSPIELAQIIRAFEKIEQQINPNWTDIEKALFVYITMIKNISYDYKNENSQKNSNLCAMLHHTAKCAGFATCYKEAMDRLGIENDFKNIPKRHSYNAVYLGNNWRVIDVTWGRNRYDENPSIENCLYDFGLDKLKSTSSEFIYSMCKEPQPVYIPFSKDEVLSALNTIIEDKKSKNLSNNTEKLRA